MNYKKWYKTYGWKTNPFSIKPNTNLVGMDIHKQKILDYISGNQICLLTGMAGVGKTSLLNWVKNNPGQGKIIYLSLKGAGELFDLNKFLKSNAPFWRRILGKYPKNTILLVDEAQHNNHNLLCELESLWDKDLIKSIIITQIDTDLENYPESFKDRMGKRIITAGKLTKKEACQIINLRTLNNHPFEEEALNEIIENGKNIPRKILENCEYLCIESGCKKKINLSDVKKLFIERNLIHSEEKLAKLRLESPAILTPIDRIDHSGEFSPMQANIIKILIDKNKTAKQLALIFNTSYGSIGKQLSKLSSMGVVNAVSHRRPKTYGLKPEFIKEIKGSI